MNVVDFPAQRFFMSLGPWMSTSSYFFRLVLAVAAAIGLYVVCFRFAREPGFGVAATAASRPLEHRPR